MTDAQMQAPCKAGTRCFPLACFSPGFALLRFDSCLILLKPVLLHLVHSLLRLTKDMQFFRRPFSAAVTTLIGRDGDVTALLAASPMNDDASLVTPLCLAGYALPTSRQRQPDFT
jgi:hypothetical protein